MNQTGVISQTSAYIILVLILVIIFVGLDFWQIKTYKSINEKIAKDPNYLADPEKKDLCNKLLQQSRPLGPFSLLEMRKLKKSLDKVQS